MDFVNLTGPFAGAAAYKDLDPGKFWTLYQDNVLASFARITALLPSSTLTWRESGRWLAVFRATGDNHFITATMHKNCS